MSTLEGVSKTAAIASVLLIIGLLLLIHPDITTTIRILTIASIAIGLGTPASVRPQMHAMWIIAAVVSPALLRLVTEREGPVLDLFWMAGMSATLIRTAAWSEWRLPTHWRVLAGGWALVVSLAWPVLLGRETGFDLRVLRDEGAINSWAMLSAPQVVAWMLYVAWIQLLGLLWLEWAWKRLEDDPDRVATIAHGAWIGATVASLVALYQGTVDLGFLSTPFWASAARATGTLLDANAFGICAALAGPLSLLALRPATRSPHTHDDARIALAFAVFVINLVGLWMSGSRTAVLCAIVSISVCVFAVWPRLTARARAVLPWAAVGVFAVIGIVVVVSNTVGPARRLADLPASLRSALSTVFTRGPYGRIATQMIREHPLVGIGLGSYQVLSPDYWRREANDALPFDNAQNWWRHQVSELGVTGSAALLLWSALIAWQVLTAHARSDRREEAWIVRALVIAVGIGSLIQVPTQTPIVMVTFMLVVGWMNTVLPPSTRIRAIPVPQWTWALVVALAIAYAGGQLRLAAGPLSVIERARRAEREYVVGTYRPEVIEGQEFSWTKGDAAFVWPVRTRYLVVRVWAQHPDIAADPVRVTLTSPCGVLLNEALTSPTPISLGITIPEGQKALEARLHVSRTWRPSDHGSDDARVLGAAIVAEFVTDPRLAVEQNRVVKLSACRPGI